MANLHPYLNLPLQTCSLCNICCYIVNISRNVHRQLLYLYHIRKRVSVYTIFTQPPPVPPHPPLSPPEPPAKRSISHVSHERTMGWNGCRLSVSSRELPTPAQNSLR